MTDEELKRYSSRLSALRAALLGDAGIKAQPNRSEQPETSDDDFQALNEMHQAIASGRNKNRSELVAQIGDALDKIKHDPDEFGLCEECECQIPLGRLNLMPYAQRCVRCQSLLEDKSPQGRKKITDYI
ncbi:MAG: TraR/DksA family transcriptional regulator [Myxococcota bacterium]|nr:TraR/DksA family transcriptional regulator [Myxococcota bacterium]